MCELIWVFAEYTYGFSLHWLNNNKILDLGGTQSQMDEQNRWQDMCRLSGL